jgi:hypothetical protein
MTLPNGIEIINATPHSLVFHDREWDEDTVTVPSHCVINAYSINELIYEGKGVEFVTVRFVQKDEGRELLDELRKEHPKALIVGSVIAAQAYPEEVVAPIPWYRGREHKNYRLLRPNRFTIFKREKQNG